MDDHTLLKPITDADWPVEISDMHDGFAGSLNVYRIMAHHPALLRAWQHYRDHVVVHSVLGKQRSEVVILRTGHRLDAKYELVHHVIRALNCGLDEARIATLRGPLGAMQQEDAVLVGAVDDLVDHASLSEANLRAVDALVGSKGVLDLMATVGLYSTLAFIVKSYDVPIDNDVIAAFAETAAQ